MTTRARVLVEACSWLRTPYRHHGDVRGSGVDCAMLLVRVYHGAELIPDIDPRPYPVQWHLHKGAERYLSWVEQYAKPVSSPKAGDIVVYRIGRAFSHGGIVVNWPIIIHAHNMRSKTGMCEYGEGDAGFLADRERRFFTFWDES